MSTIKSFQILWGGATPEDKKAIFDIVFKEAEEACHKVKKLPPCPYERIKDLYHEVLPELPQIRELSETRKRHIKARWRRYPSIDLWRQYFGIVRNFPFLMGMVDTNNGRKPFVADIDYLINEHNWIKIIEGKYSR